MERQQREAGREWKLVPALLAASVLVVSLVALPAVFSGRTGDTDAAHASGHAGQVVSGQVLSGEVLSGQAMPGQSMPAKAMPGQAEVRSSGLLYVPAYGHVYYGAKKNPFSLTITLSIRNTDMGAAVTVTAADYYDTAGKLLRRYVGSPVVIGPLATHEIVIPEKDESGGSGANFLVRWQSDEPVNPPLVEAVMIGTGSGQGISFTSRAVPVSE